MQYAYKPEELERLKKTEMEVLAAFIEICEKHDLPYFVNGGTAIGAVRHQGFIPWDDDMDVGMLRDDYEKFLQVAPGEIEGKYELMNAEINKDCLGYTMRMCKVGTKHITDEHSKYPTTFGIRIDIFPYDNVPEDPKLRKKQLRDINLYTRMYVYPAHHPQSHGAVQRGDGQDHVGRMLCGALPAQGLCFGGLYQPKIQGDVFALSQPNEPCRIAVRCRAGNQHCQKRRDISATRAEV